MAVALPPALEEDLADVLARKPQSRWRSPVAAVAVAGAVDACPAGATSEAWGSKMMGSQPLLCLSQTQISSNFHALT